MGSRSLENSEKALHLLGQLIEKHLPTLVVSGGARGIDTMAVTFAKSKGIKTQVFLPFQNTWPEFKKRNILIAETCNVLCAIMDPNSKTYGSGWTADYFDSLHRIKEKSFKAERYYIET